MKRLIDADVLIDKLFALGKGYKGFESPYIAILDAIEIIEDTAIIPCDEPKQEGKPQKHKTNRDVLAEMSNEELAKTITQKGPCDWCQYTRTGNCTENCYEGISKWLSQEAEETK